MNGKCKGFDWNIERHKNLDITGDTGKCYIFKCFKSEHDKKKFHRESMVKRYSKSHKRVMYDNSYDTFMCSNQKDMAKHLCYIFDINNP